MDRTALPAALVRRTLPLRGPGAVSRFFPAAALLTLCACATQEPPSRPVVSLIEMRQAGVVVQQWDLSCAAAALATILRFQHDIPVTEKAIAESMLRRTDPLRVRIRGGFSLLDLKRYAETRGLKGIGYTQLSMDDLSRLAPAIVPVDFSGFPHFVVFRGTIDDRVLLADPAFGNRLVHADYFRARWLKQIGFIVATADGSQASAGRLAVRPDDVSSVPHLAIQQALKR